MKNCFKSIKLLLPLLSLSLPLLFNTAAAQPNKNHVWKQSKDSTLILRQKMIHSRSPLVMPFKMDKVTHYFIKTDNGGILMIKAKNIKDTVQISLIRSHLKKEYSLFSKADFRDPEKLHGTDMPGLKVLTNSKGLYKVVYKELSDGAELTFTSNHKKVIKALHRWFDAQLQDHGSDAKSHE